MNTVTIACKLPNGLLLENLVGGVRTRVRVNGSRLPVNAKGTQIQKFELAGREDPMLADSYGLTPNVPADFWEQWERENAEYPAYKRGLIFATGQRESTIAMAKELVNDTTSGFEPMDPEKPGRDLAPADKDE